MMQRKPVTRTVGEIRDHLRRAAAAEKLTCSKCNGTGWLAIRSRDGAYAFPGPVPDDARGYTDADCWFCDSGRPLTARAALEDTP